jgi:hypothetical protein
MITIRPARERGHTQFGWLDSWHSFSFGEYHDPAHTSFRSLRVINDDVFAAGTGFGMHPHRDMEIITVVLNGALEHRDNLGNGSTIRPGVVQRMTAGTGILHSEHNPSSDEPVRLLQIWIQPETKRLPPSYQERQLNDNGAMQLVASRDGREESLTIHQDVDLLHVRLATGESVEYALATGRHAWLQMTAGQLLMNGVTLSAGDGAAVSDESALKMSATADAELLLFDLA